MAVTVVNEFVNKTEIIKEVSCRFGISLKAEQEQVIRSFVTGNDVFVSLPTGFGKSLCFMLLPPIFDSIKQPNDEQSVLVVVISPLNSLMLDQVEACGKFGLRAACLCGESEMSQLMANEIRQARYQVLYVSPEYILTKRSWRDMLLDGCYQRKLVGLIVDEAHCVKSWGEDFRPAFKKIGELRSIIPKHVNIMALTATVTTTSRLSIEATLGMKNTFVMELSPEKKNIYLSVLPFESIKSSFKPLISQLISKSSNMDRTIIFCKKRDDCAVLYAYFKYHLRINFTNPPGSSEDCPENRLVDMFCSGTEQIVKDEIVKLFKMPNSNLRVVIATIAFGMGIDSPNVRMVIHLGPPSCPEDYIQQIGRGGRDNLQTQAILYYGKNFNRYCDKSMLDYCSSTSCFRDSLFKDFQSYNKDTQIGCKCCDYCKVLCQCVNCQLN
jgi:ATP-dependent DNA helicase RecQ